MREESHLDDMRSAIRGDFERLERRRGAQELMHVRTEPAEVEPRVEVEVEVEVESVEAPRRSWLARLLAP